MARYLKANLDASGFACSVARGAEDAWRAVDLDAPDAIILDGGARGMRDHSLLRELLARGACPVLFWGGRTIRWPARARSIRAPATGSRGHSAPRNCWRVYV